MLSLSTPLCIVTGPGTLSLLRNLTNLVRVWASTHATSSCSLPTSSGCDHLGPQEEKITKIILDEFIDLIKVIRIKTVAFNAEMPFDRFGRAAL